PVLVNLGDLKFADATTGAGKDLRRKKAVERGGALGDIDNDGRVDAVVTDLYGPIEVWKNVSPVRNHWLEVQTVGTKSNRDGMGAKIKVVSASGTRYGHVTTAVGYGGGPARRGALGPRRRRVAARRRDPLPPGAGPRCRTGGAGRGPVASRRE